MSATFRCGCGCGQAVTGIYCDASRRTKMAEVRQAPPVSPGETVAFTWRGKERQGVVESVARVNAIVLIELGAGSKRKQKLIEVRMDTLRKDG